MSFSNPESLNMGIGAIRLKRSNLLVMQSALVGNITAEWNTGQLTTMAAAQSYPSYVRNTGSEGGGTITLVGSRPAAIDGDIAGGTVTTNAAASDATVGTLSSTNGTTLNATDITVTTPGTVVYNYDLLLEAVSTSMVTINYISDRGEQRIVNVVLSSTATPIADTGISIAGPSSPNFTVGDRAEVSVTAPHGGHTRIEIPAVRTGRYYDLTVWGATGGADDSPEKVRMPRVYIGGANYTKTAKEMPAVELPFTLCAPLDNSAPVIRDIYQPEA